MKIGGHPMKTALLLVDIQNDYFPNGHMELEGAVTASEKARKLLAYFREKHLPVIHIQHVSIRKGANFFLPNTEGVLIHHNVQPLPSEVVIQKHYPNGFRNTSLKSVLEEMNIKRLIICGMMTHMCIDATVRAACDFEYECIVIHDACATRSLQFDGKEIPAEQVHNTILASLNGTYAQVISLEELFKTNPVELQ